MPSATSKVTSDHEEIQRWAEERGAKPSCVRGTGDEGDIGMLRLDFPGYSGRDSLEEIDWNEWFDKFDERGLALLFQENTARGQRSNFNKLVSRETAREAESGRSHRSAARSSRSQNGSRSSGSRSRSASGSRSRSSRSSSSRSSRSKSGSSRSRSASTRSSAARGKRNSSSRGRSGESGSRTSRGGTSRTRSSGLRSSGTRGGGSTRSRSNSKRKNVETVCEPVSRKSPSRSSRNHSQRAA